jgi:hypothetical protein
VRKNNWKIFFPLLLGTYAAIELVSVNISQMVFSAGMRSILAAFIFSLATYFISCLLVKNEHKAALFTAWFLLFFFAYGHVYESIEGVRIFGFIVGRHRYLIVLWMIIFGFGAWLIIKKLGQLESVSRILNLTSIVLFIIPVFQIGLF